MLVARWVTLAQTNSTGRVWRVSGTWLLVSLRIFDSVAVAGISLVPHRRSCQAQRSDAIG